MQRSICILTDVGLSSPLDSKNTCGVVLTVAKLRETVYLSDVVKIQKLPTKWPQFAMFVTHERET